MTAASNDAAKQRSPSCGCKLLGLSNPVIAVVGQFAEFVLELGIGVGERCPVAFGDIGTSQEGGRSLVELVQLTLLHGCLVQAACRARWHEQRHCVKSANDFLDRLLPDFR